MENQPRLLKSGEFQVRTWAGGTTKELFIFPPEARYPDLNFHFRISTATVETGQSEFTRLPGVSRKLMVLSGATSLTHEGHHSRKLTKFETDAFEGDWKTTSAGRCTDFNLMTTGETTGEIQGLEIREGQSLVLDFPKELDQAFIYLHSGRVSIQTGATTKVLEAGDLLVFPHTAHIHPEITGFETSGLVFVHIRE